MLDKPGPGAVGAACALLVLGTLALAPLSSFPPGRAAAHEGPRGDSCGCPYMVPLPEGTSPSMHVNSTDMSHVRTANMFQGLAAAIRVAHACKVTLKFPDEDDRFRAFVPPPGSSFLDFSKRRGPRHPDCDDDRYGARLKDIAAPFRDLPRLPGDTPLGKVFYEVYDPETTVQQECLRKYLGYCEPGFCAPFADWDDTLVAHIRQGDLFDRKGWIHPYYGQPPLAGLLAALAWRDFSRLVLVAEDTPHMSPVFRVLKMMRKYRALKVPVELAPGNWSDHLRTLVCAPNLLFGFSTLNFLLKSVPRKLTFAVKNCFRPLPGGQVVLIRPNNTYLPYRRHDNSSDVWLAMLLEDVGGAQRCTEDTGSWR
ncbi:hypothetical protein DFJ74DRAFT_472696 [Hyaloraphidium curvatum]|nr:hypothetical protein DFJ74DRAFT_472696 [Hyaloraphidium curvatum]